MDFPDFEELEEATIQFHTEAIDFVLSNPEAVIEWIETTILTENHQLNSLNFIFVTIPTFIK